MLQQSAGSSSSAAASPFPQRKSTMTEQDWDNDAERLWSEVSGVAQKSLLQGQWRAALDKWHARMNFGSEKVKAKLKVFNHMAI